MPGNILGEHEREWLWTKIWHLVPSNRSPKYAGLLQAVKQEELRESLRLLNHKRWTDYGTPSGDSEDDTSKPKAPAPPASGAGGIWNPALYPLPQADPKLWIDYAKDAPSGERRGTYRKGYPEGIVWHWTAGHRNGLVAGNQLMRDTGMLYLLIDAQGGLAQSDSLRSWGYHAGASAWGSVPGTVSNEFIGVELQAAGMLEKRGSSFYAWFGKPIYEDVIYSEKRGNIARGHYQAYTAAQMFAVRRLTLWLHLNNPGVFRISNVVGHDEVSPGRKTDPGASPNDGNGKPWTMAEVRKMLENDVDRITEAQKKRGM